MQLGGFLSENILCMLAYHDQHAPLIRNSIPLTLWGGPYRIIAARCYDYIDRFHQSPKDHLPDILEDRLTAGDATAELLKRTILNIKVNGSVLNVEYVLSQLQVFIKRQSLRSVSVELAAALQKDTEEGLDQAERLIAQAKQGRLNLFDPGTRLSDRKKALKFLDMTEDAFPTGIPELDKRGFGPTRKELLLFIADTKGGKSWWLNHLAKMAITHRLKVADITLEMSEARRSARYFQILCSISKRKDTGSTIRFKKDDKGQLLDIEEVDVKPKLSFEDPDIRQKLEKFMGRWGLRMLDNIFIKQFPTGKLTTHELEAYLDGLEATHQFIPDLLIIDYPDLMKQDKDNFRLSIDETYKNIRGLVIERNIAGAIVSQSNRAGSNAKVVRGSNVAEAYSKIAHCDTVITRSATDAERQLGLARLYVTAGRNDEDNFSLIISQHFRTGAFVMDSVRLNDRYWPLLDTGGEDGSQ